MNTNLLDALKKIVSRHGGVGTLADARRVKALLADLTAGEPKPQKNALTACIELGFIPALQNVSASKRGAAKAKLAERLNREEGLDPALCADTLDLLEAALFGGVSPKAAPPNPTVPGTPAPQNTYYLSVNYQQTGPFSLEQLKSMIGGGRVTKEYRIRAGDRGDWKSVTAMPEFKAFFANAGTGGKSVAAKPEPARPKQQTTAPNVTAASKKTAPHQAQTTPRILPKDLAEVFGTDGVTAAFNAVHAYLQTCNDGNAGDRRERIARRIMLGDWIDLPHLTVQEDGEDGAINTDNTDLGGNGKLLRLIVVGIDSFAATNKDALPHIVFQFQNLPGFHRMNAPYTNSGGYRESEMRHYLADNFLRGLLSAGVPEGVLYAPTRYIANDGPSASAADALADWLWLPTERELFGRNEYSNETWETAANQARLEYYEGNGQRTKYTKDRAAWWWEASPPSKPGYYFGCVTDYGTYTSYTRGTSVNGVGCAPAFCVR
jgi:hypothetical protein